MAGDASSDIQQLQWLSIVHYAVAVMAILLSCLPIMDVGIPLRMALHPESMGNPPPLLGWMGVFLAVLILVMGVAYTTCLILAGRFLTRHCGPKRHVFCLLTALVSLFFIPFGTVLGIFTIIVLMRPSVKELFAAPPRAASTATPAP